MLKYRRELLCTMKCFTNLTLLCRNSGLLKKIMHADNALSASCKKCWTAESIEACEGLCAIGIPTALGLLFPFHRNTLWSIYVSGCVRYGGNWMAQTLGHTLTICVTNWLLIMHGWPYLSSQTLQGPLPICCLDT